jgi:hypothetical protein
MAYGSALDVQSCVKREGSWTFARVNVRTYAVRVGLGWGTRHGVWVGIRRVSWTDEDVGFFEGGECHTRPNLDGHEWPMSAGARV